MRPLLYSDVTPKHVYLNRRQLLAGAAAVAAAPFTTLGATTKLNGVRKSSYNVGAEKTTPYEIVTRYNNFYEFGTGKDDPVVMAKNFNPSPWSVKIEGAVAKPQTIDLDVLMKLAPLEERIYRHRCVEGWSIVVPWIGYSLNALIKQVEPTSNAKFVAFESFYDPKQMLSPRKAGIGFPYVEGLRMDEAMNPLAMLCVGLYGETLPNQNGAPVRLVVPWKYGFKSIKSIVRIRFVDKQPPTTWNISWPAAYGFYSNVNPSVEHPRYSQAEETRLGEGRFGKEIKTQMFNGYADQVASMYTGMDLKKYY